jgi:hypothetical protein
MAIFGARHMIPADRKYRPDGNQMTRPLVVEAFRSAEIRSHPWLKFKL